MFCHRGKRWERKLKRAAFAKVIEQKRDSLRGAVCGAAALCPHTSKNLAAPKTADIPKTDCLRHTSEKRL